MSNARDYVLLEYGGMGEGAVLSGQLCPSCHGGTGGESSMSVGKSGGLLWWRCHRNKCGFRGMHGAKHDNALTLAEHPQGRWNYSVEPLSKPWLSYLSERFRILDEIINREWQWTDSYEGRVVMPVRNERNITTAYTLRSYNPDINNKALIHRVAQEAGQAWYQSCPYPSHVLLVEDQPSALKASLATGINAIALLRTYIPEQLINTIKLYYMHNPTVVVSLDQDATVEAFKQALALRGRVDKLRVFPLSKDIKNLDDEEYIETMTKIKEL